MKREYQDMQEGVKQMETGKKDYKVADLHLPN